MSAPSIDRNEERIAALLDRAEGKARLTGRAVLVSVTEPLGKLDPLETIEALALASGCEGEGGNHFPTRMYWSRASDDFEIAGFGSVIHFAPAGDDRFTSIDSAWNALVGDSMIDDASRGVPGVGPTLMGGFAFDPVAQMSGNWRDFPAALVFLPRLQLTIAGDERWLTSNAIVAPDDGPDSSLEELARLRKYVEGVRKVSRITPSNGEQGSGIRYSDALPADEWRQIIGSAISRIRSRDLDKVVLAREERAVASRDIDIASTLRHLRAAHPDCYVFGFWHGASAFVGATPERLVRLDGRTIRATSLAGSVRRGATPDEDSSLIGELHSSAKERREHEIVRRALHEGLSALCDDITGAEEPTILTLKHVHHLHTAVRAHLRDGYSLLDVVARLHPTPAVGGEPREAALRFIREREKLDRGWYAAPVGWLQRDHGEFAVALRSALITGRSASLFAGCGIVADSIPELEYEESLLKLRPMELALDASQSEAT